MSTLRPEPTTDCRNATPRVRCCVAIYASRSLVITDEDYIQFVLRMSRQGALRPDPVVAEVLSGGLNDGVLGYSLLKYDLRPLSKALRWKIYANVPDMCSVDSHPDPLIMGVWQSPFVPALYALVRREELGP
jgi:hypothetical protein